MLLLRVGRGLRSYDGSQMVDVFHNAKTLGVGHRSLEGERGQSGRVVCGAASLDSPLVQAIKYSPGWSQSGFVNEEES